MRLRKLAFWTVALASLDTVACLKDFDPAKIECISDATCPSGYTCTRTASQDFGTCVSGANDASMSDAVQVWPQDGAAGDRFSADGPTITDANEDSDVLKGRNDGPAEDAPSLAGPEAGTTNDTRDVPVFSGPEVAAGDVPTTTLANGLICTIDAQCASGHCVDGVCCDGKCDGQCESCREQGTVGTCEAIKGAPLAPRTACGGSGPCKGQCDGSNRASCSYPDATLVCSAASCASGKVTTASVCNAAGTCTTPATSSCASNLCLSDGTAKCSGSCTDTSCGTGYYCDATGACIATADNGKICSSKAQCTSGNCVDGICCNTQCDGQCESCSESGSLGMCKIRTGAPLPTRAACAGSGSCKGQCDGSIKACVYAGSSTACTQASCTNGNATPASYCDGAGNCPVMTSTQCASNLCAGDGSGKCASTCTSTSCGTGSYCNANGACATKKAPGVACSSAGECASGNCVDGVCCSSLCSGQCQVCDATGTCVRNSSGTPSGGRTACTGAGATCGGTCNGTSDSCVYPGANQSCGTATCSSDLSTVNAMACNGQGACSSPQSNLCSGATYCSGGACTGKLTAGACQSSIQCQSGNCTTYSVTGTSICCAAGYSNCGSCSNLQTDTVNCGSCGNKCGPNRACSSGSCSCSGYAFPCGGCGSWNFESGTTEGWVIGSNPYSNDLGDNGVVNVLATNSVVHGGSSHALAVPLNMDGTSIYWAAVAVPLCQTNGVNLAGFTLSFYVYFAGTAFMSPMGNGISADAWGSTGESSTANHSLYQTATNTWVQIQLTFPTAITLSMDHLDIRFASGVSWVGTMYLDDIQLLPPG